MIRPVLIVITCVLLALPVGVGASSDQGPDAPSKLMSAFSKIVEAKWSGAYLAVDLAKTAINDNSEQQALKDEGQEGVDCAKCHRSTNNTYYE